MEKKKSKKKRRKELTEGKGKYISLDTIIERSKEERREDI